MSNDDLKADCHKYLDMMWQTAKERKEVYKWLARRLNIPLRRCHISKLSSYDLYRARRILRQENRKRRKKE